MNEGEARENAVASYGQIVLDIVTAFHRSWLNLKRPETTTASWIADRSREMKFKNASGEIPGRIFFRPETYRLLRRLLDALAFEPGIDIGFTVKHLFHDFEKSGSGFLSGFGYPHLGERR
jgi:hypothetical protein